MHMYIYNFRFQFYLFYLKKKTMAHGISDEDPTKTEQVDPPDVLDKKLDQLADWIRNAKHFIVFTG